MLVDGRFVVVVPRVLNLCGDSAAVENDPLRDLRTASTVVELEIELQAAVRVSGRCLKAGFVSGQERGVAGGAIRSRSHLGMGDGKKQQAEKGHRRL
jgi:hypothetical protein